MVQKLGMIFYDFVSVVLLLFQMTRSVFVHAKFFVKNRLHPLFDNILQFNGDITYDLLRWGILSMDVACFQCVKLTKCAVKDRLLYYVLGCDMPVAMCRISKSPSNQCLDRR